METSLLATKLTPPPVRPQLVSRPGLLTTIRRCPDYSLTLVSAPAGFGKTTLVGQWVHDNLTSLPIAWLSLDKSDDDPVRYWRYFIGSLHTSLEIDTEEVEALLRSPGATTEPDMKSFVTVLINSLAPFGRDFVMVLDDYHLIENPVIHQSMIFLLEHLPPVMHIVIATREDPPFPLARFLGKGILLNINDNDLRFNNEDASRLMDEYQAPVLTEEDIAALNERTEGWAVGLKMAALSMKDHRDAPDFIRAFTGSQFYIMDYLIEEVLQTQSEDTKNFLLTTSVLDKMTGPLCDALTGEAEGQEKLASLEKANLFIQPLDEVRTWYRYEHLFADLLRHQLRTTRGLERVQELHQSASRWHETNGDFRQAVEHALRAEDWELVIRLLESPELDTGRTGEGVSLIRWMKQIPPDVLTERPRFHVVYCRTLGINGQLEESERILNDIAKRAGTDRDLLNDIAMQKVNIAWRRGSPTNFQKVAMEAAEIVPEDNFRQRAELCQLVAFTYCYPPGDVKMVETMYRKGCEYARLSGVPAIETNILGNLANLERQKGNLRLAIDICRRGIEEAGDSNPVNIFTALGVCLYECNDLDESFRCFEKVVEHGRRLGVIIMRGAIRDLLASILYLRGDHTGAEQLMNEADFQAYRILSDAHARSLHAGQRLMFSIHYGSLEEAELWGERQRQDLASNFYNGEINLIRLQIARGEREAASFALEEINRRNESGGLPIDPVLVHLYQALAAKTEDEALVFLDDALARGEPEGYVRTFVDEQRVLKPLLRVAAAKGLHTDYARRLLGIMEQEAIRLKTARTIEPLLSRRELEILELMASGTPNQDIAERLSISLSTVKTHVHHVIEKLEVKDRSQAVFRAKELNIL